MDLSSHTKMGNSVLFPEFFCFNAQKSYYILLNIFFFNAFFYYDIINIHEQHSGY